MLSLRQAVHGSVGLVPIAPLSSSLKYAPQNWEIPHQKKKKKPSSFFQELKTSGLSERTFWSQNRHHRLKPSRSASPCTRDAHSPISINVSSGIVLALWIYEFESLGLRKEKRKEGMPCTERFPHVRIQLLWGRCEYVFSMLYLTKVDILMIARLEHGSTTFLLWI